MSVQYEAPNSDSVKSTSVKDSSSPVEATVERHVYQEISSTEVHTHGYRFSPKYIFIELLLENVLYMRDIKFL